jgi:hypothetical protein
MKFEILLLMLCTFTVSAQNRISFDSNCLNRNSVLFTEAMMDLKGEQFIKKLLKSEEEILMFCRVDSLGYLREMVRMMPPEKPIPENIKKEITAYLFSRKIPFYICYTKPADMNEKEAVVLITNELFRQNDTLHLMNVGFPGDLMKFYNPAPGTPNTLAAKFEYLKGEMRKVRMTPVLRNWKQEVRLNF